MGPGTKLAKRLKRGDPGINRLDKIAKQHDIDYSHAKNLRDKWKADEKMIKAINKLPGTASAEYTESDPKRSKLSDAPAAGSAEYTELDAKRSNLTDAPAVKSGTPTNKELERLSHLLGDDWISLVRNLFNEDESNAKINKFGSENRKLEEKAYQMLLHWKQSNGSGATYEVLYQALSEIRKDLAEKFCLYVKEFL
ncbi:hypothetical protein ACROYT_G016334 [Oculina patagonica]